MCLCCLLGVGKMSILIHYVGGMLSFECHVPVLFAKCWEDERGMCYVGGMLSFECHVPVLLLGVGKTNEAIHYVSGMLSFKSSPTCVVARC